MPHVIIGTCLFVYIYILLEIQITETVWLLGFLGFTPLLRLPDGFPAPALQILIHRTITGSGTISSAVKPPGQSGTAMSKMIIFNKRSQQ